MPWLTSLAGDRAGRVCGSAILLLAVTLSGRGACAETRGVNNLAWRIERDVRRARIVGTDNVMELLAVRPGMAILDIGAGTGQFAYEFARRVGATGKVDATEIRPDLVEYISEEASRRGLPNLRAVVVGAEGLDAFYGRGRYDLITLFHVSMPYEDRIDYFRGLRGALAETGRLALVLYKVPTPFGPGDFAGDFRGLMKALSEEGAGSPFHGILRDSTRRLLADRREGAPLDDVRSAVIEDFNAALTDAGFAARFPEGSVFRKEAHFLSGEQGYADWILPASPGAGARNADVAPRRAPIDGRFSTINKLLIVQRYRRFLEVRNAFASGFTPALEAAFAEAGFRVVGNFGDAIPFEDLVILSPR